MSAAPPRPPEPQRLRAGMRAGEAQPLEGREWTVTLCMAGAFVLALALPMAVWVGGGWPAPGTLALLIALYAVACTVEVDLLGGRGVPTQVVLVPMLFVLPAGIVPFAVLAGLLVGATPRLLTGRLHPERLLTRFWGAAGALGPALVFGLADPGPPSAGDWPVYLAALVAQLACGVGASTLRERLALGVDPREHLRATLPARLLDVLLWPLGLLVAVATVRDAATALLALALLALLALLSQDRTGRMDRQGALGAAEEDLRGREAAMRALAAEQAALRRVASAVAADAPQQEVFSLVARELAELLGVERGLVGRFTARGCEVVGAHGPQESALGTIYPLTGDGAIARVAATGRTSRVDHEEAPAGEGAGQRARRTLSLPPRGAVAAPVWTAGHLWGAVLAADPGTLPAGIEERLSQFAALVGLAISNARDQERLTELASTDPLTGLANRRTFQERLALEVERARRYGRPLALAVFDLDHFKAINDTHGHQTGDRVLVEAARRLTDLMRAGELIARVGGEEFAWLLPETDGMGAFGAAERCRRAIGSAPFPVAGSITTSAGVCDLDQAGGAAELFRLADVALYWAKANGRDATFRYSPDAVRVLSADEQEVRVKRSEALVSIRVLARAVDAKDPSTQRHSERVADLSARLARVAGWSPERATLLREAGLVHDVGKIGVRDAVLLKPGSLTVAELEEVKLHAELGARIVSGVLSAEQSAWVRGHHERWDGSGYPDGLAAERIADGAALLALADAWDAMSAGGRSYRATEPPDAVMAECERHAGTQFAPFAVDCLRRLYDAGSLADVGEAEDDLLGEPGWQRAARTPSGGSTSLKG